MKRRNADCGKLRRPIKRNKITDGMYGSNTLLYMKFLILWAIVITADFMLEFRFEFLWPFWLLLRSVHDSFKYKGLAFSVLFVCIAITSDLVCLFFIPVHWLFFAASTYVWVQYVWHTDKGICLPTIILWMLFVYLEAAIRWKDSRHMPHLDLCRPFAAHCIGYPVVTLGFGFKSYVGYRIRQRKQREVAKENEFYMQLLQQALPQEETTQEDIKAQVDQLHDLHKDQMPLSVTSLSPTQQNSLHNHHKNAQHNSKTINLFSSTANGNAVHASTPNGISHTSQSSHKNQRRSLDKEKGDISSNNSNMKTSDLSNSSRNHTSYHQNQSYKESSKLSSNDSSSKDRGEREKEINVNRKEQTEKDNKNSSYDYQNNISKSIDYKTSVNGKNTSSADSPHSKHDSSKNSNNSFTDVTNDSIKEKSSKLQQNGGVLNIDVDLNHQQNETVEVTEKVKGRRNRIKQKDANQITSPSKDNQHNSSSTMASHSNTDGTENITNSINQQQTILQVCESCLRLEAEVKKFKSDCSHLKQIENELRQKLETNATTKNCLLAKQKENEELEKKLQDMLNSRQIDRQTIQSSERRLGEERRQRQSLESQLNAERKQRKIAEEKAARAECGEACKQRKLQLEAECKQLRRDLLSADDSKKSAEQQSRNYEQELRQFEVEFRNREAREGTEVLMSALAAMQDKNTTLEKNLSAETRVKLDLFSALGEAKRQLEIRENMVRNKDKEVLDLKAKIAQLLAVMPSMPNESFCMPACSTTGSSMLRLNDTSPLQGPSSPMTHISLGGSPLISQLQSLGVFTSTQNTMASTSATSVPTNQSQQQSQQQGSSNLDPNATAYTPKNLVGGTEA